MNKDIVNLLLGIVLIIVLVAYVVPKINQSSNNPVMQFVNKNELDTGVLFYTESEEGLEATLDLKSTIVKKKLDEKLKNNQ